MLKRKGKLYGGWGIITSNAINKSRFRHEYPHSNRGLCVVKVSTLNKHASSSSFLLLPPLSLNIFRSNALLAEVLHQLAKLSAGLLADLVLGRAHDSLENGDKLASQTLDGGLLGLEHGDDHVEDGLVLTEVVPEREELDETRQDLGQGDGLRVGLDHAGDAAGGVVDEAGAGVVGALGAVDVEDGLEDLQDWAVVVGDVLVVAVGAEEAGAESRVGLRLGVLVLQALGEDGHHALGVRGAAALHGLDAVGHGADGSRALEALLGRGVLDDEGLEHLPELAELVAKSDSEAGNDLHGGLDDEPVVLGGLLGGDFEVFEVIVVPLARVLLLKDEAEVGSDLLERSRRVVAAGGEDGGAAELQSSGDVAVDLGDNTPGKLLACAFVKNIFFEQCRQVA